MKNDKDFKKLIVAAKQQDYSDKEILEHFNRYISKHPLSLCNSDLRIKMLPSAISLNQRDLVKENIEKIRFIDIHDELVHSIEYSLFLLKEYGFSSEYEQMLLKSRKCRFKPASFEQTLDLISGKISCSQIKDNLSGSRYQNGILLFYSAVEFESSKKFNEAIECFDKAAEAIPEMSMRNLIFQRKGQLQ